MRIATVLLIGLLVLAAATAVAQDKAKPYVAPVPGTLQLLDCSNAIQADCDATYYGDNTNAPNNAQLYSCVGWTESGGEIVYELNLAFETNVTVTLSNMSADFDAFLLGSCDEGDCITYGDSSFSITVAAGLYYLVVDGYMGATGTYTMTIECVEMLPPCCPFDYVCCWVDFNVEHCNLVLLECDAGAPVWEWGVPVGIPAIGCDDVVITKVLGTVLAGDYPTNAGEIAMSGPFMITDDCSCLELCHYYDTESGFDGGNVKVSTDAGMTWQLIHPARGYDRDAYTAPNCVGGEPVFSGHQFNTTFLRDCFDLTDFIGQSVWFGFFFGSDSSVQYPGWYIKWIKTGGGHTSPVEDASWSSIKAMYR